MELFFWHQGRTILSDPGPELLPWWSQGVLWEHRTRFRDVSGAFFGLSGRGQPGSLSILRGPSPGTRKEIPEPGCPWGCGFRDDPGCGRGRPQRRHPRPRPRPSRPAQGRPYGGTGASGAAPAPGECERDGASSPPFPSRPHPALHPHPRTLHRGAAPGLSRAPPRSRGRNERRRNPPGAGGTRPPPLGVTSAPPSALGIAGLEQPQRPWLPARARHLLALSRSGQTRPSLSHQSPWGHRLLPEGFTPSAATGSPRLSPRDPPPPRHLPVAPPALSAPSFPSPLPGRSNRAGEQ